MSEREVLDGWKEISTYLKRNERTCQRWERELGLPIHRLDGSPRARVFAYKDELDGWRKESVAPPNKLEFIIGIIKEHPLLFAVIPPIILLLGALFNSLGVPPKSSPSSITLVVLPCLKPAGRAGADPGIQEIPHLLIGRLSGSSYFNVLSYDKTVEALRTLALDPIEEIPANDLVRLAREAGATHTIRCTIINAGSGSVAVMTVRRPETDEAFISRYDISGKSGLDDVTSRMANQALKDLGLTRSPEAGDFDGLDIPVTTRSPRAFQLYNEARRLYLDHDNVRSLRVMGEALAHDREFALAWRSQWSTLRGLGRDSDAEDCIQKALEYSANATSQERLLIKTHYFHARGEFAEALEACREWTELYPDDTSALVLTARTQLFLEDLPNAAESVALSLTKGNRSPYTYYLAINVLGLMGRYEEACRVCEQGLSVHPNNRFVISARVSLEVFQGLYDKAVQDVHGYGLYTLDFVANEILLLKGDYEEAREELSRLGQATERSLQDQALLCLAEGRFGRAAEVASRLKNRICSAYIEARRGRLAAGLSESEEALGRALAGSQARSAIRALQVKGWIEVAKGDLEAARATQARLREFTESDLQRARLRTQLFLEGLIAGVDGDVHRAAEALAQAVERLPPEGPEYGYGTHAMYLDCAAAAAERIGDKERAAACYQRILSLHLGRLQYPDLYALAHHSLGRLAEEAGKVVEARRYLTKFLDLWKNADPGLPEVDDAKARLAALD